MKNTCKSICLGVQNTAGASIIMMITQTTDAINFARRNKFKPGAHKLNYYINYYH